METVASPQFLQIAEYPSGPRHLCLKFSLPFPNLERLQVDLVDPSSLGIIIASQTSP
jgi:hypothetical protein